MLGVAFGLSVAGDLGLVACGTPSLPRPALAPHKSTDLVPLATPPPPAKVEIVPPRPEIEGVVWIDGEWSFEGRRARWRRGRWLIPPRGARFAPWVEVRADDGQLYFAPGKWIDASGADLEAPRSVLEAESSKTTVLNDVGEEEDVGRDITQDSKRRDAGPR